MRSLSSTILAKQLNWGMQGAWKVVFTSGATTYGYLAPTIEFVHEIEQVYSQIAQTTMNNANNAFTELSLQGYKAMLSWGIKTNVSRSAWVKNTAYSLNDVVIPITTNGYQYKCTTAGTSHATTEPTWTTAIGTVIDDGAANKWTVDGRQGEEYSECAPMWVEAQQLDSIKQTLTAHFTLAGMFNRMAKDSASIDYTVAASDTQTVKTLLTAIANKTVTSFTHCDSWDVQYDTGWDDSLINAFIPAEGFSIHEGETRLSKLEELLSYTKCVMRPGNDSKLHILNPTVSGETYDSQYALDTDTHKFLGQTYRKRLIIPNKIWVKTRLTDPTAYSGSATDTDSYTLLPHDSKPYRVKAISNDQCDLLAAALLQKAQQDAEKGTAIAPMNIGSELWDYVKVTDKKMTGSLSRVGNLQYIERIGELRQTNSQYSIKFTFGKLGESALNTFSPPLFVSGGGDSSTWLLNTMHGMKAELVAVDAELIEDVLSLWYRTPLDKEIAIEFNIGDGVTVITTGIHGRLEIPFACTINRYTLCADVSGSIVIDIWKEAYASLPATVADTITASAKPTLSTAQTAQSSTLTGWTTSISAGSWLYFNVDSCTTITMCTISLKATRL